MPFETNEYKRKQKKCDGCWYLTAEEKGYTCEKNKTFYENYDLLPKKCPDAITMRCKNCIRDGRCSGILYPEMRKKKFINYCYGWEDTKNHKSYIRDLIYKRVDTDNSVQKNRG